MAQVQLVDEDHDDGAAGGARPDGRGWRRRRWWVMGAAGLLAVGAAAFAVVDEQERQADLARYADVPGTVDSLAEPPQEAWRAELDGQAVQLADLLVSAPAGSPDPASPTSLTGRDLDTGAERWRVEGPGGAPGLCVAELAGAEGPVLLCVLPDPEEQDEFGSPVFAWRLVDAVSGAVDPAPQAVAEALMVVGDDERVVLLRRDGAVVGVDVRTREELWEQPLEGRARVQLDGRLVLSERDRLVAVDVRTGETRWETELPSDVDGATSPTLTDGLRLALSGVRDGRATPTAFDLASGGRLWDTRLPEGTRTVERYGRAVVAVTTAAGREPFIVLR